MHALSYPIHRSHIKSKTDFLYSQLKGESRKGNARGREGGRGVVLESLIALSARSYQNPFRLSILPSCE
jgi:hypothetical protein